MSKRKPKITTDVNGIKLEHTADGSVLVGDGSPLTIKSTKDESDPILDEEELSVLKTFKDNEFLTFIDSLDEVHKNAWIQTYSGRKFYPLNPYIDSIVIQDIAHALSMQCRYTGHTKFHYSIAQHSVGVSYLCDKEYALQGLLHDASEAYISDISSPIKRVPEFDQYKRIENNLQQTIYARFGVFPLEHKSVKRADLIMLSTEASTLLSPLHSEWKLPTAPLPFEIKKMSPEEAEKLFLDRFWDLFTNKEVHICAS